MIDNMIELRGISKSFNHNLILDNVDLIVHKGEIVSFIGDNGTGKSTIIKMIAGLIYQDEGTIKIFGIDNHDKKIRKFCEFVFESGQGFYGYLTAYENIRYFLGLNKIKFKAIVDEYNMLCDKFSFHQHLYKKVDELSQGNRQKMALILSLLSNPKILMLDEPTNGLDQNSIDILSEILISRNKEKGMTILMTSHDINFLEKINVRKLVVQDKTIKEDYE